MPLRLAAIGLEHYHITGWIQTLEGWADQIEIVALYDPDPALGERLAPTYHDPVLADALSENYRALPFFTDLDRLIAERQGRGTGHRSRESPSRTGECAWLKRAIIRSFAALKPQAP